MLPEISEIIGTRWSICCYGVWLYNVPLRVNALGNCHRRIRLQPQVGKKIADIWKSLPENEKEGYKERAGQAKAEYDQLNPKQPKQARCTEPRRHCLAI